MQAAAAQPYGPKLPLPALVEELNRLYHSIEAPHYDASHPEIHTQLPPVWRALVDQVVSRVDRPLAILNFGCGTGFEAEQLLALLPAERVAALHCYDPAPEMLARCRVRVGARRPGTTFSSQLAEAKGPFDLLVTNAVLHHLPDVPAMLAEVAPRLAPACLWISGHEPSSRFFKNGVCLAAYQRFLQQDRWRRFFSLRRYQAKLLNMLALDDDPARRVAELAFQRGLFSRQPPASVVSGLVDFHVANSPEEARGGRGFDLDQLTVQLGNGWKLLWSTSYSFMGPYYEGKLSSKWRREAHDLAVRFPKDGSNWSALWQRMP